MWEWGDETFSKIGSKLISKSKLKKVDVNMAFAAEIAQITIYIFIFENSKPHEREKLQRTLKTV